MFVYMQAEHILESLRVLGCPKLRYGVYAIKYKPRKLYRITLEYSRDTLCLYMSHKGNVQRPAMTLTLVIYNDCTRLYKIVSEISFRHKHACSLTCSLAHTRVISCTHQHKHTHTHTHTHRVHVTM